MDWAFGNVTYKNSAPGVVEVTAEWSPDDSRCGMMIIMVVMMMIMTTNNHIIDNNDND